MTASRPERRERHYLHGHPASTLRSHGARTAETSAAYLLPHLEPADVLLDVGCGPGSITLGLARYVPQGRVIGIDAAPAALDAARETAIAAGDDRTKFRRGDVYALDLPDASVDVVHAHQVLQHLADPVAALREMRRVCRPGGIVAVRDADYAAMFWHPQPAELEEWRSLYRRLAQHAGGDPDAGRRLPAWVRAAGFDDVRITASTWAWATREEVTSWARDWSERVRTPELGGRALDLGLASAADIDRISQGWLDWGEQPDAMFVVPSVEALARA